jgi:ribosomal protein L32
LHSQLADSSSYIDDLLIKSRLDGERLLYLEKEIERFKTSESNSSHVNKEKESSGDMASNLGNFDVIDATPVTSQPYIKPPEPALPPPLSVLQQSLLKKEQKLQKNSAAINSTMKIHEEFTADRFLESLRTRYLDDRVDSSGSGVSKNLYQSFTQDIGSAHGEDDDSSRYASSNLNSNETGVGSANKCVFKCKTVARDQVTSSPQSAFLPIHNKCNLSTSISSSSNAGSSDLNISGKDSIEGDEDDEDIDITEALALANLMVQKHKKVTSESNIDTSLLENNYEGEYFPEKIGTLKKLWRELHDEEREEIYYFNQLTEETRWQKPSDLEMKLFCKDGFVVDLNGIKLEADSGADDVDYAINVDATCNKHNDHNDVLAALSACIEQTTQDNDTIMSDVTCNDFESLSASTTVQQPTSSLKSSSPSLVVQRTQGRRKLWREFFDDKRNKPYYHCKLRDETTWVSPSVFQMSLYCENGLVVDADGHRVDICEDISDCDDKVMDEGAGCDGGKFTCNDSAKISDLEGFVDNTSINRDQSDLKYKKSIGDLDDKKLSKGDFEIQQRVEPGTIHKGKTNKGKRKPLWREQQDATSGEKYFFNRLTRDTTWTYPGEYALSLFCENGIVCDKDGHLQDESLCDDSDYVIVVDSNTSPVKVSGEDLSFVSDDIYAVKRSETPVDEDIEKCELESSNSAVSGTMKLDEAMAIANNIFEKHKPGVLPLDRLGKGDSEKDANIEFSSDLGGGSIVHGEIDNCLAVEEDMLSGDDDSKSRKSPIHFCPTTVSETSVENVKFSSGDDVFERTEIMVNGDVNDKKVSEEECLEELYNNGVMQKGNQIRVSTLHDIEQDDASDKNDTVTFSEKMNNTTNEVVKHHSTSTEIEKEESFHVLATKALADSISGPSKSKAKKSKTRKGKRKPLWSEIEDASSGEKYFFNRLTRATTWTHPGEYELNLFFENGTVCDVDGHAVGGSLSDDSEYVGERENEGLDYNESDIGDVLDVAEAMALANKIYDKHKVDIATNVQQSGDSDYPGTEDKIESWNENHQNVEKQQSIYSDLSKSKAKKSKTRKGKRKPLWSEIEDASSGEKYFFNRLTRATTWTHPGEYELNLFFENGTVCDVDGHAVDDAQNQD